MMHEEQSYSDSSRNTYIHFLLRMPVVPREMYCNCGKAKLPRKPETANSQKTQKARDFIFLCNLPKPPTFTLPLICFN
jgi:hypothetical protein